MKVLLLFVTSNILLEKKQKKGFFQETKKLKRMQMQTFGMKLSEIWRLQISVAIKRTIPVFVKIESV